MSSPQAEFFDAVLKLEPEEATSLGLRTDRWRRWDEAGLADEDARLHTLEATLVEVDDPHDAGAMRRWIRWRRHAIAEGLQEVNTEAWALTQATLTLDRLRARSSEDTARLAERLATLGEPLEALAGHHRAGAARQRTAHPAVLAAVDDELAGFAAHLDAGDPAWKGFSGLSVPLGDAQRAVQRYRVALAETASGASPPPPLGPERLDWCLRETMGLSDAAEVLVVRAREGLAETHAALLDAARQIDPDVRDHADVRRLAGQVLAVRPEGPEGALALYRGHVERAVRRIEALEPGLLPAGWALRIAPAPAGLPHAANWPAPLMAPGQGCFFVSPDPAVHSRAWAADLAVHEGIPGHYLQSAVWQARFGGERAPVRCLFLSDPVAIAHRYWGTMAAVEGWAVYAERWMLREGFFTPVEALCARLSDAIRFARLCCDLSLQAGWMTEDQATELLTEQCLLGEGFARGEVLRYRRIPLQACTYAAGMLAIERLQEDWAGPGFHRWLLEWGAVPPDTLSPPGGRAARPPSAGHSGQSPPPSRSS